ncbi:MAG: hypothetical protein J6T15_02255 [Bacilli bacterium]|nr:hypothetical protein [Bacilli bacterium]
MKKGKLFLALGLSFAFAFVAGRALNIRDEVKAVKADTPAYSGSFFVQKNDGDMKYTGSKLVAHFFDNSEPQNTAWGEAVWNTEHTYQKYEWSLNFEPTQFIVLRVDGNNWNVSNPWGNVWCRTGNINLADSDVVWMAGNASEGGNWGVYSMETLVIDDGGVQLAELDDYKVKPNGEGLEAFGKVSFEDNQKFYIKKTIDGDNQYNNYSCLDGISSNLRYFGNYIEVLEAATYELYFDFNGNTTYLTDPVVAEADEWSQAFLGTECSDSKSGWGTYASTYAALSPEAQALLAAKEHIGKDDATDTEITRAIQRYDYVLQRYGVNAANTDEDGYADFMGRVAAGKISLAPRAFTMAIGEELTDSNTFVTIFVTIALLSIATGYLVIRRRRINHLGK